MEKQKQDEQRGATHGARVEIETDTFQIPTNIKELEREKIGDESRL